MQTCQVDSTKSRTRCKKQENSRYVFIYKNHDTLRYTIFHENFELDIYVQKPCHFALRGVSIHKKSDSSQKSRQFALCFYIQKNWTLCVTRFFIEFVKLFQGG